MEKNESTETIKPIETEPIETEPIETIKPVETTEPIETIEPIETKVSDTDSEAETETDSDAEIETDTDSEAETETDTEAETETDSDSDTKIDNISWFKIIKSDFEKGNFPKIDPLGFLPPFPAAAALQVMGTLNNIFQTNQSKVAKLATVSMDSEIAKKEHEIEEMKNGNTADTSATADTDNVDADKATADTLATADTDNVDADKATSATAATNVDADKATAATDSKKSGPSIESYDSNNMDEHLGQW
jgi:hypothetical protein